MAFCRTVLLVKIAIGGDTGHVIHRGSNGRFYAGVDGGGIECKAAPTANTTDANLVQRGLTPWLCLCYGNGIYDEDAAKLFGAVGCPPIKTDEQVKAWHDYVVALVKRYHGRCEWYEVWNEPDGQWCWKHGPSGTEYGNFVIATAKAIKEADPTAKIMFAFYNCTSLIRINIPNSVTEISGAAFSKTSLTSIVIPDSVTKLGSFAFFHCKNLTSVDIPNSIENIRANTFTSTSLINVYIPNNVTGIGPNAFANCHSLTSVTITGSVIYIGPGTFSRCPQLKNVVVPAAPDNIIWIYPHTFSKCPQLKSVVVPENASIWPKAFDESTIVKNTNGEIVKIPEGDICCCPFILKKTKTDTIG